MSESNSIIKKAPLGIKRIDKIFLLFSLPPLEFFLSVYSIINVFKPFPIDEEVYIVFASEVPLCGFCINFMFFKSCIKIVCHANIKNGSIHVRDNINEVIMVS